MANISIGGAWVALLGSIMAAVMAAVMAAAMADGTYFVMVGGWQYTMECYPRDVGCGGARSEYHPAASNSRATASNITEGMWLSGCRPGKRSTPGP